MNREPIFAAIGTKEILTSVLVLAFLFARDFGVNIPEDTKLQIILVATILGGAIAGWYARGRSTPTASPTLTEGTIVTTTTDSGQATGTTTV